MQVPQKACKEHPSLSQGLQNEGKRHPKPTFWRSAAEAVAYTYPAAGSRDEPTRLHVETPVAERKQASRYK